MEIIKVPKLTNVERETILNYNCEDKVWSIDTLVMKHYNKAKKQGWTQTKEYRYTDGTVCGGCFEAPSHAVTFRSAKKKKMSDKQMKNLSNEE